MKNEIEEDEDKFDDLNDTNQSLNGRYRNRLLYRWKPGINYLTDLDEIKRKKVKEQKSKNLGVVKFKDPKTPFQALRYLLSVTLLDWNSITGCDDHSMLSKIENGFRVCPIPLAKIMIIEAERRGVIVTLDDLYQNIIPHDNSNSYTKESGINNDLNKVRRFDE